MNKRPLWIFIFLVTFLVTSSAHAWVENVELLGSAEPDECWAGIGLHEDPISTDPFTCRDSGDPENPVVPYTKQTYVWGQTVVRAADSPASMGEQVWFGTGANVLCTTQGAFYSEVSSSTSSSGVCEFGDSPVLDRFPGLPGSWGDWYPPKIYQYDAATKTMIDRTPYRDPLRNRSKGIRSAGNYNGVVYMAGGVLGGGIAMFAYNAATGEYLGSQRFYNYRTIRKWKRIGDAVYTGVGTSYIGQILRCMGSVSNPFNFITVGTVQGVPRELSEYIDGDGRTRVATSARGVFLSPAIVGSGLVASQSSGWTQVWTPNEYEPDFTTRTTYVGGGIGFLNGWLYFATMHIPGNAANRHETCTIPPYNFTLPPSICFGDIGDDETSTYKYYAIYLGTQRATSVWRIRNAESPARETQLLYGEENLPAYDPDYPPPPAPDAPQEEWWAWLDQVFPEVPNVGGYVPLLGSSGFNNDCNNYTWTMETAGDSIFMGTMDYCAIGSPDSSTSGADLWRIDSSIPNVIDPADPNKYQAVAETTKSFKCGADDVCDEGEQMLYTYSPYGFRTLDRSEDGTKLYGGMATGVNLNAVDDGNGWQFLMLDSIAP